ncbi:MAG: flagellar hook-basal body complex protein FliE [Phycisphaerales bacterium]
MSDPLGLVGGNSAFFPRVSGPGAGAQPGQGGPQAEPGGAFKDALLKNLDQTNQLQAEASTATEDLLTGKRTDVEGVLLATQKADTAFRMLLSVRNKVLAAYDELKQVRI